VTIRLLARALVFGYARANALRTLITVLAVALGVAASFAIQLANATAVASFRESVDVVADRVNLQVLGAGSGFDERALLRVQSLAGIESAAPEVDGELLVGARTGVFESGEILHVMGVDVTRATLPPGACTSCSGSERFDVGAFVNGGGIVVSDRVARAYGLRAGSPLEAFAGPRAVRLRVMGVIPRGTAGVDSSVAFVDVATAQELFDKIGKLDRIDLVADPSRLAAIRAAVAARIPHGARVLAPRTRVAEIERMLSSFRMNLGALAYIALLVGMYLIYNAVAISVVQRRAEIGTLRALGARKREIFAAIALEGVVLGVFGSLLGLLLGYGLAGGAAGAVEQTVSTLYVGAHADAVAFSWGAALASFALGVAMSFAPAVLPAWEAASTPPARTVRAGAGFERHAPNFVARCTFAACALLALAFVCMRLPAVGESVPLFGYAGGALAIAAASLFTPLLLAAAASVLSRASGTGAALVAASFFRGTPRRFCVAIASLAVAVGMMIAIAVLVGSFRSTIAEWSADVLGADLYLKPPGTADASYNGYFDPQTVARVARVPGVAAVDTFRGFDVPLLGRTAEIAATDMAQLTSRSKFRILDNVDPAALARELQGRDAAIVSEPFATHFGLGTGDSFALDTPSGPVRLRIAAVYNDYSTSAGTFAIDRATFVRLFRDEDVDSIAVYVRRGYDLAAVRTAIERAVAPLHVDVGTNRELRGYALAIFDRTFAITSALYAISMVIAILGVVSTLFALVLERRMEIALLRYVGLTRTGVQRTVFVQALAIGSLAGLLGLGLGLALAADLIYVINRQSFGWLIEWQSPGWFYLEALAAVVAAAVVAAVYPAHVASRIATAEVLRAE
jgi:putative ABC transport system permease protein